MKISEYIQFLEELIEKYGDIQISVDTRAHDEALEYNKDLNCVFSDMTEGD